MKPGDARKPATSTDSPQAATPPAHPWNATCGAYRSVTVSFPGVNAQATYNLQPIVQEAPHKGWTCKASEPLFGLEQYPVFFRSIFSIILGTEDDSKEHRRSNELHKHQDKHVFFAFNPCKLLPHTCHGSRGRLFKFAAKLKNPHDPDEEIDRLLARFLKLPQPPSEAGPTSDPEEEADTTECLQNVLPTNTTFLYSHRHESLQQHPSSNGLGGLWEEPDISDDPTPWEPLDPTDPYKGLQSNMRHTHIFCPDSSLHTHVVIKCPSVTSGHADFAKFESCEHVNPCLFRMVLTARAACPTDVHYGDAAAASSATPRVHMPVGLSAAESGTKQKEEMPPFEELQRHQDADVHPKAALASGGPHAAHTPQHDLGSSRGQAKSVAAEAEPPTEHSPWRRFSFVLVLGIRLVLCLLIFAWIIYAIRDWTQSKMEYAPFPEERPADAVGPAASLNSYDSCIKALAGTSHTAVTDDSRTCEMASRYTDPPVGSRAEGNPPAYRVPRREFRGLYSSSGRRFVSMWLPHTLDLAAQQAHALAVAARDVCGRITSTVTGSRRSSKEFTNGHVGNDRARWDWTDAIEFHDNEEEAPAPPKNVGFLGLSEYETI